MTKSIEVEVYGQRLSLRGDGEERYVHELAQHVDEHMREVAKSMKTGTPAKLAILAAINIADQLFQQRAGDVKVERLTQAMLDCIEHQLESRPA